jgi:hypothetical protein
MSTQRELQSSHLRDLPGHLQTWAEAGLITTDQAEAIRGFERTPSGHDVPRWVEPVAYLGATLVGLALFLFGMQVWDQLATWSRVALAGLVTLVLLGTGLALFRNEAVPVRRAASFALLLTVAGVTATAALTVFEAVEVDEDLALILTAACTTVVGLVLYLLSRTTLQQIGLAAGVVFLAVAVGSRLDVSEPWTVSLMLFTLGAIWLLLTWGGLLQPAGTGWVLGGLLALAIGFGGGGEQAVWSGLGVAVGLGLVYLSAVVDLRTLMVIGVLGLVVWIPATVTTLFQGTVVVPVAILITGMVTLTVVVAAVRHGRRASSDDSSATTAGSARESEAIDA